MLSTDKGTWYSATDLLNWLGCAHRSALDAQAITSPELRDWLRGHRSAAVLLLPDGDDRPAFDTPAQARGDEHERNMLARLIADGHTIVEIDRPDWPTSATIEAAAARTLEAMRDGADVVFQAALLDAPWYGFADFLVRVDGVPSAFGDYSYEVRDTKLARHASASALIQMAHYGAILAGLQEVAPARLVIWLGTGEEFAWRYDDAAPYLREARTRFLQGRASAAPTIAEPVKACAGCRWFERCSDEWGANDLIHVHRLTRRHRLSLRDQRVGTIDALASAGASARPSGMASATFARLREQARVQSGGEPFALVTPQSRTEGLTSIPAPDPGDIYFDLEGDPFAAIPTLDYLWAFCDAQDAYQYRWGHTTDDERVAFAWFVQTLQAMDARGGRWHVYHYNSYETTSMRRIARDWPDAQERQRWIDEVERLIEARFVDLYRAVESGLRTRDGSTSLKIVERLAGYDRSVIPAGVAKADDSIVAYENYAMSRDEEQRAGLLAGILAYNTHDVRATHAVHVWLHGLAATLDESDFDDLAVDAYLPSPKVLARADATARLRDELRAAADGGAPLPSGLSAEGALMLAHMLEWHRAESVVQYLDFRRLKAWAVEEAEPDTEPSIPNALSAELNGEQAIDSRLAPGTEHESCLLDVQLAHVHEPVLARKNAARQHDFTCRPGSWKIKAGDQVEAALTDESGKPLSAFTIEEIDPQEGTFSARRGTIPPDVGPLVLKPFSGGEVVWDSLMRLGREALSPTPSRSARQGLALLDRVPPADASLMRPRTGESASDRARRIAADMAHGTLPVQGPPGTGKTWLGARLIADEIQRRPSSGPRPVIVITANSHRVIDNLLLAAADYCDQLGLPVVYGHVGAQDKVTPDPRVVRIQAGNELAGWIDVTRESSTIVVGATKYALAREDMQGHADILVIDEAGQLPLADALAVTQVAPIVIALGDPQQLAAPIQAAHEESVEVSVLEHLAQGHDVLPHAVGVFLDVSYRMHGALCEVIARLAYDGELRPSAVAARRDIHGKPLEVAGQSIPIRPGVAWIPLNGGPEQEVDVTLAVIDGLVKNAAVTLDEGSTVQLTYEDIVVVAPHNAHVNRIAAYAPAGLRVGTVDKFQGQEGHVVVYSMGRLASSPGDVPFLYELNRLNVALSRARLLSIVVSQRDATFPPVSDPTHLMLASRFIEAITPP